MSSASDIKDKDVRDQFLVGLKQVIADLRAREVKEFENVADALSVYRRKFFAERENGPLPEKTKQMEEGEAEAEGQLDP